MYRLTLLLKEVVSFQIEPFIIYSVGVSCVMESLLTKTTKTGA